MRVVAIEFLTAGPLRVVDVAAVTATEPDAPPTLLDAVRAAGLPLGQSCRGEGVCRSCAVDVEVGAAELPPLTALEARFGFRPARRLSCQVVVPAASVRVRLHHPAWGRPATPPAAPTPGADGTLEP